MNAFVAILLGGIGTYLMRASFLAFIGEGRIPQSFERSLRYVGPAVFAAITLPRVLGSPGLSALTIRPTAEMFAILVAGVVAYKTRHVPATLALGMVALWLLRWMA